MIRVNKFELYRELVCTVLNNNAIITTTIINNTFHYNFTFSYISTGRIWVVTNQSFFKSNKTICIINNMTYGVYLFNSYDILDDNTIQIRNYDLSASVPLVYQYNLTIQVYF